MILERSKVLREKMYGVVEHIESGVRTLNQMQLRELVRMLGALSVDLTTLKIKVESLLEEEEGDTQAQKHPTATPQPEAPDATETVPLHDSTVTETTETVS